MSKTNPRRPDPVIPGLGPKSTAALAKIGITSLGELRRHDPFDVYAMLKQQVPGTSLNLLYGLMGALEELDWRVVCNTRRTEILLRLDDMGIAPK